MNYLKKMEKLGNNALLIAIIVVFITGLMIPDQNKSESEVLQDKRSIKVEVHTQPIVQPSPGRHLTDEEIRELREDNPEYIIKTPGRIVLSRKELFEQQMEDYIEENHDELLDKYKD